MNNLKYILAFLLTSSLLFACDRQANKNSEKAGENEEVVKSKNVTETISTDIDKLGKLLDFSTYKPTSVKFKYTYIDNSGPNKRISVPGPSDYSLEALLYFDTVTMEKFYEFDRNTEYDAPNFKKEEFNFDWLPNDIREELLNSNPNYHGHPDFFFGTGDNGKSWYLENKILIRKHTN
jgi:hypothetical protein